MGRLIIVDPKLSGYTGHHYNFNLAIVEQARRHGMEFATLANAYLADPDIASILQAVPVFEHDQYRVPTNDDTIYEFGADDPARDPAMRPTLSTQLNLYFFQRLNEVLTPLVTDDDVVVFHSLTVNFVAAVGSWLLENTRRCDFRTIIFMISADYEGLDGSRLWQTPVYETFLGQVAELDPGRLDITAETPIIAEDLTRLSGGRVVVGESPHMKPVSLMEKYLSQPSRNRGDESACIAGYLGETRVGRGSHLMPGVVDHLADLLPERLQFLIHVDYSTLDLIRRGLADEARASYSRDGVKVVDRRLPVDEYYDCLKTPDLMIFPYPERYAKIGSGVFRESLALGKLMVVPRDSVMDRVGTGSVVFDEPTENSVAAAVRQAVEDYPTLAETAREVGLRWQREHDPTAYFDRFLGSAA